MISITSVTLGNKLTDKQHTTRLFHSLHSQFLFSFYPTHGLYVVCCSVWDTLSFLFLFIMLPCNIGCVLFPLHLLFPSPYFSFLLSLSCSFGVLSFGHLSLNVSFVSNQFLTFFDTLTFLNAKSMSLHSLSSRVVGK